MIETGEVCVCEKCGHRWLAGEPLAVRCSKCKARTWNVSGERSSPEPDRVRAMAARILELEATRKAKRSRVARFLVDQAEPRAEVLVTAAECIHPARWRRGNKCLECGKRRNEAFEWI